MNRRNFITTAGAGLLSLAVANTAAGEDTLKLEKFGIQLWSVRHDMSRDPKAILKALRTYGYTQIESFSHESIFWGMKPKELKAYLDEIGLSMESAHCNSDYSLNISRRSEFEKLVDDAAGINMKYLINPFMIQLKTIDDFKRAAEAFNQQGEICKRAGLRFAYHNHNYTFREVGGVIPQRVLMESTDPALVDFEMDIYWVVDAGHDPIVWLQSYPNRFRLCHIKDHYDDQTTARLTKAEVAEEPELGLNVSCDLGKGKIDFKKILEVASQNGMQYYFVEQERFDNSTPMVSAKNNAEYMKKNFGS